MPNTSTALLGRGKLYDVIVDVVGDETSLEFCTLSSYYLDDNDLDTAMRANGTHWDDTQPLVEEVDERAKELRTSE